MTPIRVKLLPSLDKAGAVGAALAAAAAPCCFPLFASVGAALGLSFLERFESLVMYAIQACVLVSLLGAVFAYRRHRRIEPLALAVVSTMIVLAFYYGPAGTGWFYAGLAGLTISGIWSSLYRTKIRYRSIITCPHCGFKKEAQMPTDACQFFYVCTSCYQRLKPKKGDCCVFCSYGSVPCPPVQIGQRCCS